MQHGDFTIGGEFLYGERRWRCTDIGTRVIVAIRLDKTEVCTLDDWGKASGERQTSRFLDQTEADREGWFSGPPYAVEELVFDEYHIEACEPAPAAEACRRANEADKSDPVAAFDAIVEANLRDIDDDANAEGRRPPSPDRRG